MHRSLPIELTHHPGDYVGFWNCTRLKELTIKDPEMWMDGVTDVETKIDAICHILQSLQDGMEGPEVFIVIVIMTELVEHVDWQRIGDVLERSVQVRIRLIDQDLHSQDPVRVMQGEVRRSLVHEHFEGISGIEIEIETFMMS